MPVFEDIKDVNLRILLYGAEGMKKTWLAGTAAEAGFNIILLDCDKSSGILKNLSQEAQKRIYTIDISDSKTKAVASVFMTYFCKLPKFFWNEKTQSKQHGVDENCIQIDWTRFDNNTVIIVDSYTALVRSLMSQFCIENNIDLSMAEKTDWEGYGWSARLATWFIAQLKTLPCHLIVIGHQQMYEKRAKDNKVEWARLQMASTSGPHGMTIGKDFTEILYCTMQGSQFYIDSSPEKDRMGGCKYIQPKRYKWEELNFKEICRQAGIELPPKDLIPVTELVKPVIVESALVTKQKLGIAQQTKTESVTLSGNQAAKKLTFPNSKTTT